MSCCGVEALRRRRRGSKSKSSKNGLKQSANSGPSSPISNGDPGSGHPALGATAQISEKSLWTLQSTASAAGSIISDDYHDAHSDIEEDGHSWRSSSLESAQGPEHAAAHENGREGGPSPEEHHQQEHEHPHSLFTPFAAVLERARLSLTRLSTGARRREDVLPAERMRPHDGLQEARVSAESANRRALPEASPASAIMEQHGFGGAGIGCMSLLTQPFAAPPKRLIRTLKPAFGSSFNRQAPNVGRVDGIECWEEADARTFRVRGQTYMRDRRKVPSQHALYRLLGCDIYSFDFKINHISRHIQLPQAPMLGPGGAALPPGQHLPPLLVLNIQLPTYPPSIWGSSDGKGHSLVYYFGLPDGWEPSMVDNPAALALWQRFVHDGTEADGTPTRNRLKLIPRIANVEQWARDAPLSSAEYKLLVNYNDKPVLTRPQHRFFFGQDYMEIVLDIHAWAYLARRAFASYVPKLGTVVFENAFVVQGNGDEELPELVLACARVSRVDFGKVRPFPARLERTASEATRMLPSKQFAMAEDGGSVAPYTDKAVVANAF